MKNKIIILTIIFISLLISCSNKSGDMASFQKEEATESELTETDDASIKNSAEDALEENIEIKMPKQIIKTASINIEVENYKEKIKRIKDLINDNKAYISVENERTYGYMISNNLTIKVLNTSFDDLVEALSKTAFKIESKTINATDVTEEFVDIKARLKTKKEVVKRYNELLKKARTMNEILEIEEKIRRITEEIEAKKGRLKYLKDKVKYSTINLSVKEYYDNNKNEPGFFNKFGKALKTGWDGFKALIIGLAYLWPLWLILGGGLYILLRYLRKLKKKRNK